MNSDTREAILVLQRAHDGGKEHHNYELLQDIYKRHGKYDPKTCMEEIRLDGSNTIANIFRGWEGVEYDEIVKDVANVIGIKSDLLNNKISSEIEPLILGQIIKKYWDSLRSCLHRHEFC